MCIRPWLARYGVLGSLRDREVQCLYFLHRGLYRRFLNHLWCCLLHCYRDRLPGNASTNRPQDMSRVSGNRLLEKGFDLNADHLVCLQIDSDVLKLIDIKTERRSRFTEKMHHECVTERFVVKPHLVRVDLV